MVSLLRVITTCTFCVKNHHHRAQKRSTHAMPSSSGVANRIISARFIHSSSASCCPSNTLLYNSASNSANLDSDGNCKFGTKQYWNDMYEGVIETVDRPSTSYSWYCGWDELQPFWNDLILLTPINTADAEEYSSGSMIDNNGSRHLRHNLSRIMIAGIGNDPTAVRMYDAGWTNMTAFDYSAVAVNRAGNLFGTDRDVSLLHADFTDLMGVIKTASVDATLDKGTLDAIHIAGPDLFAKSVQELARVTADGGVVMCISNVVMEDEWHDAFSGAEWEMIHDGGLAFASGGEATIDLGASLYSWRRTPAR